MDNTLILAMPVASIGYERLLFVRPLPRFSRVRSCRRSTPDAASQSFIRDQILPLWLHPFDFVPRSLIFHHHHVLPLLANNRDSTGRGRGGAAGRMKTEEE